MNFSFHRSQPQSEFNPPSTYTQLSDWVQQFRLQRKDLVATLSLFSNGRTTYSVELFDPERESKYRINFDSETDVSTIRQQFRDWITSSCDLIEKHRRLNLGKPKLEDLLTPEERQRKSVLAKRKWNEVELPQSDE